MSKEKQRLYNLYTLAVSQEKVLQHLGIIYRMNNEHGWFEFQTKEALYKIHPKGIAIAYRIGGHQEEWIYTRNVFSMGLLTGIEHAFKRYKYRGTKVNGKNEQHTYIKELIVKGFDLRKFY